MIGVIVIAVVFFVLLVLAVASDGSNEGADDGRWP